LVRHIVHYDDTMSPPVVRRCDRTEPFLASCIPLSIIKNVSRVSVSWFHIGTYNLQFDCLAIKFNCPNFLTVKENISTAAIFALLPMTLTKSTPIVEM
jgi:hypothetical protein